MDYETARNFLIDQGTSLSSPHNPDAFLMLLKQGKPPIPGQMTSILLALKIVFDALQETPSIDRPLIYALHVLSMESLQLFAAGEKAGTAWPPLLKEDLNRIAIAVKSIFSGTWQGN